MESKQGDYFQKDPGTGSESGRSSAETNPDPLVLKISDSSPASSSIGRRRGIEYPLAPYLDEYSDTNDIAAVSGFSNVPLTVVNVLVTPTDDKITQLSSPKTPEYENITIMEGNKAKTVKLVKPNLARAFGRKGLSYQRRQRFSNLCCILFCPFSMVMLSLILKILVSHLSADDVDTDYEVLYCSNQNSINEQNWPVYNVSSPVIVRLPSQAVHGATRNVRAVNYLSRLSLVDVAGKDPITQLASASLASSVACVQWFGEQYPTGPKKIYEADKTPSHSYSTKDSLYGAEIRSGWLDVLEPTNKGRDLKDGYGKQAVALLRTFMTSQTRPWAIVGVENNADREKIGNLPRESPFSDADRGVGNFKKGGSGILDTIEARYYVNGLSLPLKLDGFQKVPYFLTNFSTQVELNDQLVSAIRKTIKRIGQLKPIKPDLAAISADVAVADAFLKLQEAVSQMPYGALFFELVDHFTKKYRYTLQFGGNKVLDEVIAFPDKGFRRLIQQSQLTNGILRNSNPSLASTVITQGTRAFPKLEPGQFTIPFGSTIGRLLYPLGISFMLPISALELVRDKESKIILMLRMNGLGSTRGYYISLYIQFFINYVLSSVVFLITGYFAKLELYLNTDLIILLVLLLLWGHLQTTLAFIFGSFFRSSSSATGSFC